MAIHISDGGQASKTIVFVILRDTTAVGDGTKFILVCPCPTVYNSVGRVNTDIINKAGVTTNRSTASECFGVIGPFPITAQFHPVDSVRNTRGDGLTK